MFWPWVLASNQSDLSFSTEAELAILWRKWETIFPTFLNWLLKFLQEDKYQCTVAFLFVKNVIATLFKLKDSEHLMTMFNT